MKRFYRVFLLLVVVACAGSETAGVDGKQYLASLEGPQVQGVNALLVKSAHDAEDAGNFTAAAQYYQQLADKNPDKPEIALSLAESLRRSGAPEKALSLYDAVLARASLPAAQQGKGLALLAMGDSAAAEHQLAAVRDAGNATWRTYNALGVIAAGKKSAAEALALFDRAERLSPNNVSVLNNKGLAQGLAGQYDASITTLSQATGLAVARKSTQEQIELNTALVYAAAGRLNEAEAIAQRYFSGPALANNMAFYAHLAQDDALARTYLDMALTQSKTFYERAWNNKQAMSNAPLQAGIPLQALSPSAGGAEELPPVLFLPKKALLD